MSTTRSVQAEIKADISQYVAVIEQLVYQVFVTALIDSGLSPEEAHEQAATRMEERNSALQRVVDAEARLERERMDRYDRYGPAWESVLRLAAQMDGGRP